MAVDNEHVVGVLPMFIVRSPIVGSRAMTMQGGLCAENENVALALINQGREMARESHIHQFILQDTRRIWTGNTYNTTNHQYWVLDVGSHRDSLWVSLDKNIRRQVRMARNNGLTVEFDRLGDRLDDLYYVLSRFAHSMGTPIYARDFLENVITFFPGQFNIAVTYWEKEPVGAYFQMEMGNTVYGMWGACLPEFLKQRATYLSYWEMIAKTAEKGFHYLDMGRSPTDTSVSAFKGQWGGVSKPIYQQVVDMGQKNHNHSLTDQVNSDMKFRLFVKAWSQLPFPVVQFLGPKLRRHVPFA